MTRQQPCSEISKMATRQMRKTQNKRGKKTCSDTDREKGRHRGEQAVEDWDPGLGVVRWAVVAGERVVWSVVLNVGE